MNPEGELRVGLHRCAGAVQRVDIASTRPDVARQMLQGRTRGEIAAAVPLLFSICGRSQAAASELACATAAGEPMAAAAIEHRRRSVVSETVREAAWSVLLDWPQALGEAPAADAVAAARAALAPAPVEPAECASDACDAIAMAAFGFAANEWLAIGDVAMLTRWAGAGRTAPARFVHRLLEDQAVRDGVAHGGAALAPPLLPAAGHADWMGDLVQALDADDAFDRQPTWRGAPAETGALARHASDPLLAELMAEAAGRLTARFVARLRELALLLAGRSTPALGALALGAHGAVAWVETARGLLLHRVAVRDGRAVHYRIVAPTEWNFHPRGALAVGLQGLSSADAEAARQTAVQLVRSLDPCVAWRIEVADA